MPHDDLLPIHDRILAGTSYIPFPLLEGFLIPWGSKASEMPLWTAYAVRVIYNFVQMKYNTFFEDFSQASKHWKLIDILSLIYKTNGVPLSNLKRRYINIRLHYTTNTWLHEPVGSGFQCECTATTGTCTFRKWQSSCYVLYAKLSISKYLSK